MSSNKEEYYCYKRIFPLTHHHHLVFYLNDNSNYANKNMNNIYPTLNESQFNNLRIINKINKTKLAKF